MTDTLEVLRAKFDLLGYKTYKTMNLQTPGVEEWRAYRERWVHGGTPRRVRIFNTEYEMLDFVVNHYDHKRN